MNAELVLALNPRLELQPSPLLLGFVELLALPAQELEQRIDREVADNPALELTDRHACGVCGLERSACSAAACGGARSARRSFSDTGPSEPADHALDGLAERPTAADRLLLDARLALAPDDFPIAEHLVGSLDSRGFLQTTVEEVAAELQVTPDRVRGVLTVLRDVGPAGLAARDVRECLLLQLQFVDCRPSARTVVAAIIEGHLEHLAKRRWSVIATSLGVSEAEVVAARDLIRDRLSPYPAFDSAGRNLWDRAPNPPRCVPDVFIQVASDKTDGLEAIVPSVHGDLTIAPLYQALARRSSTPNADRDTHNHVRLLVRRAADFMLLVQRRSTTIERVVTHVANRQYAFVMGGPRHLRPLRRSDIARDLGLHESTVSRAIGEKTALLPTGRCVALAEFFSASVPVEQALRELLEANSRRPSDRVLAARLGALGFHVARRTVAKYRGRLDLAVNAQR